MKKKLLVLLTLVMVLSAFVLSGCTTNGNGFMSLNKEMAQLPQYSYTGDMTLALTLPASLTADSTNNAADTAILEQLKNLKMTLSGNYIAKDMYQDFNMGYTLNNKQGNIHFVMDKATMYINAADLTTFMSALSTADGASDVAATEAALKGVTWLKMDSLKNTESLGKEYSAVMNALYNNMADVQKTLYEYMDTLNASSFAKYQPDIFTNSGNTYALNITAANFAPVTKDFITYAITNKDAVIKDTKDFLTNHDIAWLTAAGVDTEKLLVSLNQLSDASGTVTVADLAELNKGLDTGLKTLDGSSIYMGLAKNATNKYTETFDMNIAIKVGEEAMAMRFKGDLDIDATTTVTKNIPTTGVKTTDEIAATLKPASKSVTVDAATGDANWTMSYDSSLFNQLGNSKITLKKVNGSYYLPLRQVSELLAENVTWDQKAKKAYITVAGKKVTLAGLNNNGTTYVKLREFEKAGYVVNWNATDKEITIETK